MKLTRWTPNALFGDLIRLDDALDHFLGAGLPKHWEDKTPFGGYAPAVDIFEEKGEIVLRAEAPGLGKDDISVEIKDGVLTLRGEKKEEKEVKGKSWYRYESACGAFQRSFHLPETVDAEKIAARYDKGVLEVRIPKKEEKGEEPRKIEVKTE